MSTLKKKTWAFFILGASLFLFCFFPYLALQASSAGSVSSTGVYAQQREEKIPGEEWETFLEIIVQADAARADTSLDVREGQELYFEAAGQISLQRGNPLPFCGPDGYSLQTMQQPFPEKNIGALIGEVVWLVSIERDEKSKEETRHEIAEKLYIGSQSIVPMPLTGHLYLTVNENLVGDNSGEFRVKIYLKKKVLVPLDYS
jgi:hypothetical protein